jgi:hypothetical protein
MDATLPADAGRAIPAGTPVSDAKRTTAEVVGTGGD